MQAQRADYKAVRARVIDANQIAVSTAIRHTLPERTCGGNMFNLTLQWFPFLKASGKLMADFILM
ncbi:hypothetical protein NV64_13905 [Erwinia sp. B116]|nr:hypothetical protein ASF13_21865 [Erwinia sp. Leaf53]PLV58586.1 hypothetical protein NV64_13905 [Erwinia sp. B116]